MTVKFAPTAAQTYSGTLTITSSSSTASVALTGTGTTATTGSTAPVITTQPASQSVTSGQTATFSVAATGTSPMTYQWLKNAATIGGATSSSYTTPAETTADNNAQFTVKVTNSAGSATSNAAVLTVNATASQCPCTVWPNTATPTTVDAGADSPVELGVSFRADTNGSITGIRFYKSAGNTGTHVGNLWSSTGTLLATATFTGETASGWQQVIFSSPVAITANTVYVASYHSTIGHYSADSNYFATSGTDNAPLHALVNSTAAPDGRYAYGSTSIFPTSTYQSTNYWVDVVFTNSGGAATGTAPSITTQPSSKSVTTGQTATFTVVATGTAPMSYQWQKNGTAISGATSATYTTPATATADNGSKFTVTVTNSIGIGGQRDCDFNGHCRWDCSSEFQRSDFEFWQR